MRQIQFLLRQLRQIHAGGKKVLLRKVKMVLMLILTLPLILLFMPFVLLVRILRPFILVRFIRLHSNRIGHFAYEPELYLCERDAGMHDKRSIDIFYHSYPISNQQLKKMWDRVLTVSSSARWLDLASKCFPGHKMHLVPLCSDKHEDIHGLMDLSPPHLTFNHHEEKYGEEYLRQFGICSDDRRFVTFHTRDSTYLKYKSPGDWSYHDYRDSDINKYIAALEALAGKGYFSFRIGAIVDEALRTKNPNIIDCANQDRSDFFDVYLIAKCSFMIATNSGPCGLATIFRKAVAFVNVAPLLGLTAFRSQDIFIPKKYWLLNRNRYMTFIEILSSGAAKFFETQRFKEYGIELIENTPEDIKDLVIEMDERLKGTWETTEEERSLQDNFKSILDKNGLKGVRMPRIGTAFLRKNQDLLIERAS